mmetsp:Transcript_21855/g.39464  ORF Transcript_21855/g.39464 Transcript_21855/m.39464 type:complete len:93 (-) Transcript_21855:199-477(-)
MHCQNVQCHETCTSLHILWFVFETFGTIPSVTPNNMTVPPSATVANRRGIPSHALTKFKRSSNGGDFCANGVIATQKSGIPGFVLRKLVLGR